MPVAPRVDASSGLPVAPRGRPLTFTFDGRNVTGFEGDTVASALHASGERVLMRSIKYHRPRGYACGVGACASCLVRIDGVPNVRACTTPARPGLEVKSQNALPNARYDVYRVVDVVFRRTFDHHAKFIRPRALKPVFHAVIRRMAGFGNPPSAPALPPPPAPAPLEVDVAVVGAGAAGLSAARAAAKAGAAVALVDEWPEPGGSLLLETGALAGGVTGPALAAEVESELARADGVERLSRASVVGLYRDSPAFEPHDADAAVAPREVGVLAVLAGRVLREVRPRALVVATGAHEVPLLVRGNDLPGVMGARAAQRLLLRHGVRPGRRAVVAGTTALAGLVADQMAAAGVDVVARVPESEVAEVRGFNRVRAVELHGVGRVACDVVVAATARAPRVEILQQADCRFAVAADGVTLLPALDADGATSSAGVFAAGACAGSPDAGASVAAGERAGRAAARHAEESR